MRLPTSAFYTSQGSQVRETPAFQKREAADANTDGPLFSLSQTNSIVSARGTIWDGGNSVGTRMVIERRLHQ